MFDDIIKPAEKFYGADDSPIEFEAEFEVDEDANKNYSFSDLEKALKVEEEDLEKGLEVNVEELEKAIDEAMDLLFGDDCDDCDKKEEEKIYDDQLLPTDDCDTQCADADCCGCENDTEKMQDLSL